MTVLSTASTSRDSYDGKLKVKKMQEEQAWLEWGMELEDRTHCSKTVSVAECEDPAR